MKKAIETLCIAMRGGAVVKVPVEDWTVRYAGERVTTLKWTTLEGNSGRLAFVNLDEIVAIWTEFN